MVTDDFSFPTITDSSVPHFATSSSLWRVASQVFSDPGYGDEIRGGGGDSFAAIKPEVRDQRKSFSSIETDITRRITHEEEDKMDMLWEQFNDELHRIYSFDRKKELKRLSKGGVDLDSDSYAPEGAVELCCVQALKMTKSSSTTMLSPRRPSLLVIFKVLKKLFLLQNSRCPKRSSSSL